MYFKHGTCLLTCFIFFPSQVGQFTDDRHCSRLRTLVSHYPPAQILHERGATALSERTRGALPSGVMKDALVPGKEFWGAAKLLKWLGESDYFAREGGSKAGGGGDNEESNDAAAAAGDKQIPEVIRNMRSDGA